MWRKRSQTYRNTYWSIKSRNLTRPKEKKISKKSTYFRGSASGCPSGDIEQLLSKKLKYEYMNYTLWPQVCNDSRNTKKIQVQNS